MNWSRSTCSTHRPTLAFLPDQTAAYIAGISRATWGTVRTMSWSKYPKVLVFYLAVLPQFLTAGAGLGWLLVLAWSHAAISLSYLLVLVTALHGARRLLMRRKVRRGLDATTGAVLLGFSARLATAHV